ncbi:MAG: archaeosortase/exosortase family protein [Hyphomicrobium sp.]|nr:archaeosortase/exosortase family protein [Hyphomicrobium sp.]
MTGVVLSPGELAVGRQGASPEMRAGLSRHQPSLVLAIVVLSTWSAWPWLWQRLSPSLEEGLSLVAAAALIVVLVAPHVIARRSFLLVPLGPVSVLLLVYAVAVVVAPDIVAAAAAVVAVLFVVWRAATPTPPPLAFYGLVALALPVVPSLQMVLGYPMRVASAAIAVELLAFQGLAISRNGTLVAINGETVQFDAPCSGVTTLWTLWLVALAGGLLFRLKPWRLVTACLLAIGVAIVANAFRAASLIVAETSGLLAAAPWMHEGIGLASAACACAGLWWMIVRLASGTAVERTDSP